MRFFDLNVTSDYETTNGIFCSFGQISKKGLNASFLFVCLFVVVTESRATGWARKENDACSADYKWFRARFMDIFIGDS